jgi:hypothetical protein
MTPAEGIRKHGFRRWYERQLIEGHMYFVTCFLCLITVASCVEQIDWRGPALQFMFLLSVIVAGGVLCVASLRWYNFLLVRAECLGAQSNCAQCHTYGVLAVLEGGGGEGPHDEVLKSADGSWIRVRCKKCGHQWVMET